MKTVTTPKFNKIETLVRHEHTIYNRAKNYVETFEYPGVELIIIAPPPHFAVDMLTRDTEPLLEGYGQGFQAGIGLEKKLFQYRHFKRRGSNFSLNLGQ